MWHERERRWQVSLAPAGHSLRETDSRDGANSAARAGMDDKSISTKSFLRCLPRSSIAPSSLASHPSSSHTAGLPTITTHRLRHTSTQVSRLKGSLRNTVALILAFDAQSCSSLPPLSLTEPHSHHPTDPAPSTPDVLGWDVPTSSRRGVGRGGGEAGSKDGGLYPQRRQREGGRDRRADQARRGTTHAAAQRGSRVSDTSSISSSALFLRPSLLTRSHVVC